MLSLSHWISLFVYVVVVGPKVKLKDLLSEAVRIAREGLKGVGDSGDGDDDDEAERLDRVAKVIGIGAVK
jgi:hypothetical protein